MRTSDIERMFIDEVREKKRTGNGIHSRTGKRGYVGKMYFPFELLSRKEKMAYKKAGKVQLSNLFDTILPREEFEVLGEAEQRNRMQYWRLNNTIKYIQNTMGISNAVFYAYIEKLGLPKVDRTGPRKSKTKVITSKAAEKPRESQQELLMIEPEQKPTQVFYPPAPPNVSGLNISYNGSYQSEEIRKILAKLDLLLDGEESEFQIELKIMQK